MLVFRTLLSLPSRLYGLIAALVAAFLVLVGAYMKGRQDAAVRRTEDRLKAIKDKKGVVEDVESSTDDQLVDDITRD